MQKPRGTVLITGASSGIGFELAKVFARHRYNLVLVARRADKLDEIKTAFTTRYGIKVISLPADLSDPTAPQTIFDTLAHTRIDTLVNNAGFATYGDFSETDLGTSLQLIEVNIAALTSLCHLFLPGMLLRRHGRIMNVASTAAYVPGPLMATYYASKAYVLSFSQALSEETRGTGVSVTCLCPGLTRTGFQERAHLEHSKLETSTMMDAATVAEAGYYGVIHRRRIVIPGAQNRLFTLAPRFLPSSLRTRIVRYLQGERADENA